MTCVRNGYSSTPSSGYSVGGMGTSPDYNNSVYMSFPDFSLPSGSTISSAILNFEMTSWDYKAAINAINVQACSYAGIPSDQAGVTGSPNGTYVPASTLVGTYAATNAAIQMFASGAYFLKVFAANGEYRKHYSTDMATLTINYVEPTSPTAPTNISASLNPFETALRISWTKGNDGTNNPSTGQEIQYVVSDDNSNWSLIDTVTLAASTTYYDIPSNIISGWSRGKYVKALVGSKSEYASTAYSGYCSTVRKNQLPNTPSAASTDKSVYVVGETIRVYFTNNGDPDSNLSGFEVATDQNETIVGTSISSSAVYVDVSTSGWLQGIQRQFRVRGYDALGIRGSWSSYTATVIIGVALKLAMSGLIKQSATLKVAISGVLKTVSSIKVAVGGQLKNLTQ